MRFTISISSALLLILLLSLQPGYCWDCSISLDGPTWVKIGRTINLTASGLPSGGQYYWSTSPYLVPNNSVATLTGFKPTYSDYIRVSVRYITPKGQSCSDVKWVYAHSEDCQVALTVASVAAVGVPTFASAEGQPVGGTCAWLSPTNLLALNPQCSLAQYTASTPGIQAFKAEYTTPSGDTCNDSHDTTFYKVGSISSHYTCVNSGSTLEKSSFVVTSEPPGYLDASSFDLTILPSTLTTLSPTATKTITASIAPNSTFDDATTTILVVNKESKQLVNVAIKIPNYVNDALKIIGVGDATDLKLEGEFAKFSECCSGISTMSSTSGSATIGLYVDAGPFTIIGVPLPAHLKKYVTLDALAVTVKGSGSGSINGDYVGCKNATNWSGVGKLSAGIDVGGEVKTKLNADIIVIKGAVKGSTGVSETITVESNQIAFSGYWDGLTVNGEIEILLGKVFSITGSASKQLVDKKSIPQVTLALPQLK